MRFSSKAVCILAVAALFFEVKFFVLTPLPLPQVPETSVAEAATIADEAPALPDPQQMISEILNGNDYPVELIVPSIQLDANITDLGVNAKGEMDVPDGNTNDVGWYQNGTIPGNNGSAVLDAHVFAAFKNLRYVKVGDDIYVVTKSGKKLHFRAEDSLLYKTPEVPLQLLFNRADAPRLNLITCAGKLTRDRSTYDHRLIVYTVLVND